MDPVQNFAIWTTYIKGYLMTSLNDDTISVSDIATKVLSFASNLADSEYTASLGGVLDSQKTQRALDFINQVITQQPIYAKVLFNTKIILMNRLNADLSTITNEVNSYEQEFGQDICSVTHLTNALLRDGYEKNQTQIQQLMLEMATFVEAK